VNGSRYRLGLAVGLALVLTLGASSCSKKDTATTSTASSTTPTTAAGGKGTSTTVQETGGTTKKPNPCGTWPASAQGMPEASKAADTAGYFVWQDFLGWHLRARSTTSKDPFKGTVRGSRDLGSVKEIGTGVKAELKGNVVTFEIPAGSELKGFDLVAGCQADQLQFALLVGANPAPADAIFVGAQGKAVSAVFIEQKV
jgi:hypothetical protein